MDIKKTNDFIPLDWILKPPFNHGSNLKNMPEFYIIEECLKMIYLICKQINFISEKNIDIYCTSCFYFVYLLKCDYPGNVDFTGRIVLFSSSTSKRSNIRLKLFLLHGILSSIHWASKLYTFCDIIKVLDLISSVKTILINKNNKFYPNNNFWVNISNEDIDYIEKYLKKGAFMTDIFINFVLSDVFIYLISKIKKKLNINKFKGEFDEICKIITKIYRVPNFCLFSTSEISIIISKLYNKTKFYEITPQNGKFYKAIKMFSFI